LISRKRERPIKEHQDDDFDIINENCNQIMGKKEFYKILSDFKEEFNEIGLIAVNERLKKCDEKRNKTLTESGAKCILNNNFSPFGNNFKPDLQRLCKNDKIYLNLFF
jgi:hypothetical protein